MSFQIYCYTIVFTKLYRFKYLTYTVNQSILYFKKEFSFTDTVEQKAQKKEARNGKKMYLAMESEVPHLYEWYQAQLVRIRHHGSWQSNVQFLLAVRVFVKQAAALEHRVAEIVARFNELILETRGEMIDQKPGHNQGDEEGSAEKKSAAGGDCAASFTSERCRVCVHHRQNLAGLGHIMRKPENNEEKEECKNTGS